MRFGVVYYRDKAAGLLAQGKNGYFFRYTPEYLRDETSPAVSLTLPKKAGTQFSSYLFSFFYGLLTEGVQKYQQCRALKLDEKDFLGRLIATSCNGAIGAVYVGPKEAKK